MADSIKQKIMTELRSYWLVWTIAIVIFSLLGLTIIENSSIFTSSRVVEYTAAAQNYGDQTLSEISGNMTITQSFVSEKEQFSRIQLPFHLSNNKLTGSLDLELKEAGSSKVLYQGKIQLSRLKEGVSANFDFPKITGAKGKKYQFTISGTGLKRGMSASVWKSNADHYQQGQLTINGKTAVGDLRFKILDTEQKPLLSTPMYALAGWLFLLLFGLSVLLLRKYNMKMHKAFLVTAIPIGLVLVLIIPPFDQLDEQEHYYRSFEVSEGMFVNHVQGHSLGNNIPVSMVDTVHQIQFLHQNGYKYSIVNEAFKNKLNPEKTVFFRNYASSYPPTIYLPQAIGMWVGRILFNSPLMMMYFGRFFNLLAYLFIVYTALKIVPIKKNLFYILALLPMALIQASSLSGDSTIISSALLFVSYILYLAYGNVEKISMKHILSVIGIGIFVIVSKIVYFPMVLLFLLIPQKKFTNKKDFVKKMLTVLAGLLLPYLIWNLLNLTNLSIPDVRIHSGVSPKDQIKFILTQPFHYLIILVNSFIYLGESKFLGMLGRQGTIYQYRAPDIVIYTYLFLMLFFGLMNDESDLKAKWRKMDKYLMVFVMMSVILLVYTALYVGYTSVGHSIIDGVQGRYLLPVTGLLFLSISNHQFINKHNRMNFWVYTIIHCCLYIFLLSYFTQINS